jgi:NAD(P)-dependent dehydrogenase (short-subunit alcohol dehydrogenase family)
MHTKQVVLITGSSTGFGRLFAETLAREGHTASGCIRISSAKAGKLCHRRKV